MQNSRAAVISEPTTRGKSWLSAVIAAALVGLGDSLYLTVKHFSGEVAPCSLITGCETVLTSSYAKMTFPVIGELPLALFGAAAYFAAFSLAILVLFGYESLRKILFAAGLLMAAFTIWLLYLQAFVIKAFCQFCLLSAVCSLGIFVFSALALKKSAR